MKFPFGMAYLQGLLLLVSGRLVFYECFFSPKQSNQSIPGGFLLLPGCFARTANAWRDPAACLARPTVQRWVSVSAEDFWNVGTTSWWMPCRPWLTFSDQGLFFHKTPLVFPLFYWGKFTTPPSCWCISLISWRSPAGHRQTARHGDFPLSFSPAPRGGRFGVFQKADIFYLGSWWGPSNIKNEANLC